MRSVLLAWAYFLLGRCVECGSIAPNIALSDMGTAYYTCCGVVIESHTTRMAA